MSLGLWEQGGIALVRGGYGNWDGCLCVSHNSTKVEKRFVFYEPVSALCR